MRIVLNSMTALFVFLALVMIAAAAGMMDKGAEILICLKLVAGSLLAMVAAAGFADLRRL